MKPAHIETENRDGSAFKAAAAVTPEECYRLGIAAHEAGEPQQAIVWYQKGLALGPDDERLQFSLGKAWQDMGKTEAAAACYRRTIALSPSCTPAYFNMGGLLLATNRFAEALEVLRTATDIEPGFAEAHNNLGIALQGLGRFPEAAASFQRAAGLQPAYLEAHCNAGRALFALERWDEAMVFFRAALALKPNHVPALHNLGLCFHKQRNLVQAEECYRKVLTLHPHHLQAHFDLGNICLDRGDLEGMAAWYRRALPYVACKSDHLLNISRILQSLERWEKALGCIDESLAHDPRHAEAHFDRALILLRTGRFQTGWKEYEWRFQRANWQKGYPHRIPCQRWDGSYFPGKTLLVHGEQGFGDTLQFARYLPLVKQRGGTVIFEAQPPLCGLLRALPVVDEVVPLTAAAPTSRPFDFYIPLLSLPGIFDTTLESIPCEIPYIHADACKTGAWNNRLAADRLRVGIVWAGSVWHVRDSTRSCGLEPFLCLAKIDGVQLVGMQKGPAAQAATVPAPHLPVVNYGEELQDFSDTAALVAALDLVISVDTAVVHLAGAMGKPVWVLLSHAADWRWLLSRDDSPWYPTLRLFRQGRNEPWAAVLERVAADLRRITVDRQHQLARRQGS
jgi:tetratricopeptide (TPR) repeat protein